ncbi:MAG: cytochrome c biogenesis protein CcsA [Fimbriimonadaceae bacterium]|nr:cytochrome c biogenesis protein CcsA [Fimbriimonadaceae bacterium]
MKYLLALAVAGITVWTFMVPDAVGFQMPELARIFFWHFPCPILASILLMVGAWFSWKYLKTNDMRWDIRAIATMELGYVFCLLTMVTGIMFSQVQWGTWWQKDPRQTSFLMVLLVYAAYFGLRGALTDDHRRATNSGVYALAALMPVLFLIFVFPRLPQVQSFHPSDSIMKGQIKGGYAYIVMALLALFTIITVWLYRMRVRAGVLELKLEDMNHGLENHSGDSAGTTVVRPVPVSHEG